VPAHEPIEGAARTQSLFRAVNDNIRDLNNVFHAFGVPYVVTCECGEITCVDGVEIARETFERVRRRPRTFVVVPGHVNRLKENVIEEHDGYVVVEPRAHTSSSSRRS
jgi:hypothetical protein